MTNTDAKGSEPAATNSGTGDKSPAATILDEVRKEREGLAADLQAVRKEREALKVEKQDFEALKTREIMGGQTSAGQAPQAKKEVSAKDYAKGLLQGRID